MERMGQLISLNLCIILDVLHLVTVQAVLEQTLHQCGVRGKASLKRYWDGLVSESRRLSEVARQQLDKLQGPMVIITIHVSHSCVSVQSNAIFMLLQEPRDKRLSVL